MANTTSSHTRAHKHTANLELPNESATLHCAVVVCSKPFSHISCPRSLACMAGPHWPCCHSHAPASLDAKHMDMGHGWTCMHFPVQGCRDSRMAHMGMSKSTHSPGLSVMAALSLRALSLTTRRPCTLQRSQLAAMGSKYTHNKRCSCCGGFMKTKAKGLRARDWSCSRPRTAHGRAHRGRRGRDGTHRRGRGVEASPPPDCRCRRRS